MPNGLQGFGIYCKINHIANNFSVQVKCCTATASINYVLLQYCYKYEISVQKIYILCNNV